MANYQEFYFLKNWQRLLSISVILFLINFLMTLFFSQGNDLLAFSVGILLFILLCLICSVCENKKIVISDDFISFENHFLGFKQQHFAKNDIQVLQQKQFGLTKIEIKTNQNSIGLYPFFWGNKNGYHLIGFFLI